MQRKDFHIGWSQSVKPPEVFGNEAYVLWDALLSRYDTIQLSQIYLNAVHDADFKLIMKKGLMNILEKQVNILEQEMDRYHLPLPNRPPKSVRFNLTGNVITDEFLFRRLSLGIQISIDKQTNAIASTFYNDDLRRIFVGFLKKELEVYDDVCKYGKLKGWLKNPPLTLSSGG
ncbi:MAG: DUF3231 family protein [Peptococcaceae bacterium]|jgi:hypothetical protein|nr:DUF3231 family protein [Peptococcaceae bacterium]